MLALRRTAGEPVTASLVKNMFVELLGHDEGCHCGDCWFLRKAKPDMVVRAADYWRRQRFRSTSRVIG
jgi:hypothetical protein